MTAMPIAEASQIGDARRTALARAVRLGWSESDCGAVALLVTEAGTNLIKHARQGVILFGVDAAGPALVFLVLDRGAGLPHAGAMADGFSTTGTPGLGLGSLVRLATESDLHSSAMGTGIFLRYQPGRRSEPVAPARREGLSVGDLSVAKPDERVCGDAIAVRRMHQCTLLAMCDGLGHGQAARDAADAVLKACCDRVGQSLTELIEHAHAAARHTRGAAVLLVEIDRQRRVARACGVGNISGQIAGPGRAVHLVSSNGTVGVQLNRIREFTYAWDAESTLLMHSDGLQSRVSLDAYAGWRQRHPMLLAGLLYRDFNRGRDDASVLVARSDPAGEPAH